MNIVTEIRESMNSVKKITEGYMFSEKNVENDIKDGMSLDDELEQEEIDPVAETNDEIKEIRKISIGLISKLDPSENADMYKVAKTIWDACDKVLSKGNVQPTSNLPVENKNNEI